MHRQADEEEGVVVIELEFRRRRAVPLHRAEDFGNAGGAAFGDFQFLEKIADAAVAVAPRNGFAFAKLIEPDRAVGTGVVDNDDFLRADADLDGFAFVVAAMIDGIGKGFFEGLVREVVEAFGLRPVGVLDHAFAEEAGLDESQRLAQHAVERAVEDFFLEAIAASAVGEIDDIDLGLRKELVGLFVEEQQADVAGKHRFGWSVHDLHLPTERLELHLRGGLVKFAADGAEEGADQAEVEVGQGGPVVHPVVEGNVVSEAEEFALVTALCADGARTFADVICPLGVGFTQGDPGLVRTGRAAGSPENQDVPAIDHGRLHHRMIEGLDRGVAEVKDFLLNRIDALRIETDRRHLCVTVLFGHADDDVTAAEIVEVVGERAKGVQHRFRIPAFLQLNALGFHEGTGKQGGDVDGKRHGGVMGR